ncbi:MAG: hypothetical protein ACKV2U_33425 [Bryobacteraceae bacterium]
MDKREQISHPQRDFSGQRRLSILRYPHQMQVDLEYRMRAVSILWHPLWVSRGALAKAVA